MSRLVTTIAINLFCFKDRGDQNILCVKLLYFIIIIIIIILKIEIKASSCFHSVFFSKAIACTVTLIFNILSRLNCCFLL